MTESNIQNISDYTIRKLSEKDYNEYYNLINTFRKTDFSENVFILLLTEIKLNIDIWVIELNNRLIATGTIFYEYNFINNICKLAHIEDICVHTDYRGQNYGHILIKYLVDEVKKNDCYKVTLYCDEKLEHFYNSSGFIKKNIEMSIYFDNV